jgi:hypothetical protein
MELGPADLGVVVSVCQTLVNNLAIGVAGEAMRPSPPLNTLMAVRPPGWFRATLDRSDLLGPSPS